MEQLKGHLDLLLLAIVAAGPTYGYDIVTQLHERSDGAFDLAEGTVYPALHRLERRSLLTSTTQQVNGRQRRTYRITAAGTRALRDERKQWTRYSNAINATLGPAPA